MITFVAIDIETTGLKPNTDVILEVAIVLLTADLRIVGSGCWQVEQPPAALERMSPYVQGMHSANGLVKDDQVVGGIPLVNVEKRMCDMLKGVPPPTVAGNCVHFDRAFLDKHMPTFSKKLGYRNLDARTPMLLAPDLGWPSLPREQVHRAMSDIMCSIYRLRMARECLLRGSYIA